MFSCTFSGIKIGLICPVLQYRSRRFLHSTGENKISFVAHKALKNDICRIQQQMCLSRNSVRVTLDNPMDYPMDYPE